MTELTQEFYKELDSLFRFYGSEITSHASYLIAWSFASAVFFYRFVDRFETKALAGYDIILAIFFTTFGIWLFGRLLYYSELSLITQRCMGLIRYNMPHFNKYLELMKRERQEGGLANVVSKILLNRIRDRFLRQVDEIYGDVIDLDRIRLWRACLVTIACFRQGRYWNLIKELL